ncbi:MAG TPA: MFS transporter, partial [Dehalococcoidia bacterium]|nr:MFS transporter [Dehalococcoidia bacterium]
MRGLRAFQHYNYRLYFSGQLVSQAGTWMQNIGQGWLVLKLTGSAFDLGVVTALQGIPMLFFALIGGVIADRVPKHKLLVVTQTVMAILALILAIDVSAGTVRIWHVYILALCLGLANAANMPAQQAFSVEMVGKEDLLNAIAMNSAQFNIARIVGPALAGVLIAVVGIALCFYLNALSFLAVIVALLAMRPAEFRIHGAVQRGGAIRGQLADGLRFVRRSPLLMTMMVLAMTLGMFAWNTNVIIPLFAAQVLHRGPEGYGVMTSAMGVGSVLAAGMLAFGSRPRIRVMLGGIGIFVLLALTFAWSRMFPLSLLTLAGMGAASMSYNTQAQTTMQTATPDSLRGRVMSLNMMLMIGSQPIGAFLTGSIAAHAGAPLALTIDALICGSVLVAVLLYGPSRR